MSNYPLNDQSSSGATRALDLPPVNPPFRRFAAAVRDACAGLPDWWLYQMRSPITIVVLGMHRSGTSCITRMVNLCGASLGGSIIAPNSSNKRGHWESDEGLAINDLILRFSGGSWDRPPCELRAAPFIRLKMRGFLGRLHRSGTAVWKDPRTVMTFPLWRPLLRRCIVLATIRHPVSVARSLARRDGLELARGLALWRDYNSQLLEYCNSEQSVHLIDFDRGTDHIGAVLRNLMQEARLQYDSAVLESYAPELRTSDDHDSGADAEVLRIYNAFQAKIDALCASPAFG
jgi:hypothetical protein